MYFEEGSYGQGLAETYLRLMHGNGFPTPPMRSRQRADFKQGFARKIDKLIEEQNLLPSRHNELQLELGLRVSHHPRAVPPQCGVLKMVRSNNVSDEFPTDYDVAASTLARITICFSCFFRREGMEGTHYIAPLNAIRRLVAVGIEMLAELADEPFIVKEYLLNDTHENSCWSAQENWGCLARGNGEHFARIAASIRSVRPELIAS